MTEMMKITYILFLCRRFCWYFSIPHLSCYPVDMSFLLLPAQIVWHRRSLAEEVRSVLDSSTYMLNNLQVTRFFVILIFFRWWFKKSCPVACSEVEQRCCHLLSSAFVRAFFHLIPPLSFT